VAYAVWPLARLLYERGPWPVQRNAAARSDASSGAARDYVAKRTRLPRAMPAQGQQNWPTENTGGGSCQGSSRSASGRLDGHAHATGGGSCQGSSRSASGKCEQKFGPGGEGATAHNSPSPGAALCQQRRAAILLLYRRRPLLAELLLRQGCVNLGVCTGRGLGSASGTAETEACEMPVYLGTRQWFRH
jgi:hypothetical protein